MNASNAIAVVDKDGDLAMFDDDGNFSCWIDRKRVPWLVAAPGDKVEVIVRVIGVDFKTENPEK
ncbi:MAG: hypothetical protein ABJA67_06745 [Chthonomonadales bacterium]